MLQSESLDGIPLLMLANKQDLSVSLSVLIIIWSYSVYYAVPYIKR